MDEFVSSLSPAYPIVVESSDSQTLYGVNGFPSSVLIGPDGKIAWSGHPAKVSEDQIEELLRDVELFPDLPSKLVPIRRSIEKGRYEEARVALEKARDAAASDETESKWVEKLGAWLAWYRTSAVDRATKATDRGDFYVAWKTWLDVEKSWKGSDLEKEAEEKVKDLLGDKDHKNEIEAGKKLAEIKDRIRGESPKKAIKQLERMSSKRYDGTLAAKQAQELIETYQKEIEALK